MTGTRKVFRVILTVLAAAAVLLAAFLIFLTATEYRPADTERINVAGTADARPEETVRLMTYNIGYGALGKEQDFFMDGGSMVRPDSADIISENLAGAVDVLKRYPADAVFLQEVDVDSHRSYYVDEAAYLHAAVGGNAAFAYNYKAAFVPYPVPMIGKVEGGLLTLTDYAVKDASRVSLPVPFQWPISTCNLKRCLLVCRMPYNGHELVLVNLHLEAYDDGEGKAAQTMVLLDFLQSE